MKKISPPFKCSNNINITHKVPDDARETFETYAGDDQELLESIREFVLNRATPPNANPVKTAYGMRRLLKDLDKLSGGRRDVKLAVLDKAIKNNWRGLFALKADEMPSPAAEAPETGKRFVGMEVIDGQEVAVYE